MNEYKVCVYTCITGDYDSLKEIKKEKDVDYLCFTNNRNITSDSWEVIYIKDTDIDNITLARKNKILMNDYIKENYDLCIWIDGATVIRGNILEFLKSQCKLEKYDMTVFNHSVRNCVYDEAVKIVEFRKESSDKVKRTVDFLNKRNYPKNNGLTETTVLIRKTHSETVNRTMSLWFDLLSEYSIRDQLTFDYAVFETGLKINRLDLNVFNNEWFGWIKHNSKTRFDSCRIFFGEYNSVYDDNFMDVKREENEYYVYKTIVKTDCKCIIVYLGQLENGIVTNVNINGKPFVTNCVMSIGDKFLLSEDPLILRVDDEFKKGDEVEISFELSELNIADYRKLLILKNKELIQTISKYNTIISDLKSIIDELNLTIGSKKKLIKKILGI